MSAQLLLLLTSLHLGQGVSVSVSVEEAELTNNFGETSTMSESKQLFSPKTYIQRFWAALGTGISSLIGLESEQKKQDKTNDDRHTKSNVSVKLPQCPVTSSECRVRSRNRVEEELLTCGKAAQVGRVVNGSDVAPGAHPWAVQIRTKYGRVFCSGTLVTRQFLVTAAHCFNKVRPSDLVLVIGNVFKRSSKSEHHQVRKVEKVLARGDFQIKTYNNDIALVKMDRQVEWSEGVRPLCLPEASGQEDDYTGMMVDIIGWGRTQYNGKLPSRLREAAVPVISQHQCRHESKYTSEEITDNMMCAGFKDAHVDACQGDSGGPLIKKEKNFKMLIGEL